MSYFLMIVENRVPQIIAEGSTVGETLELFNDWCYVTSTYVASDKAFEKLRECLESAQASEPNGEPEISSVVVRCQVGHETFQRLRLFVQVR